MILRRRVIEVTGHRGTSSVREYAYSSRRRSPVDSRDFVVRDINNTVLHTRDLRV